MELDELKHIWDAASNPSEKQPFVTHKTIDKMTESGYKSKLQKIVFHETLGTIFAFSAVAYMIVNFSKLTTPFFQGIGVLTALLLIVLPIISLILLRQINSVGDVNQPFAETLRQFARQKLRFIRFQQTSVLAAYVLLVFVILLMPKFTGGKSLNENKYFWSATIAIGYIFLSFFSKWVLKSYSKALHQAEELLKELQE
jgi:cytochrome c biogenesis protein CcdA